MMPGSAKAPFDSPDWIFEIKLDGYRAITVFDSAGSLTSGRGTGSCRDLGRGRVWPLAAQKAATEGLNLTNFGLRLLQKPDQHLLSVSK
jgi:hypothetical protein